jgi:hypothetical protein
MTAKAVILGEVVINEWGKPIYSIFDFDVQEPLA